MSPEQLGPKVYLSGSMIRKVESGDRTPTEDLVIALEDVPELGSDGALRALYETLGDGLKNGRVFPGWFAAWPEKEAQAVRLRSFEGFVVPGLLQTQDYCRAVLSTRVGVTAEEVEEGVTGRLNRQEIFEGDKPPELWVIIDEGVLRRPVGSPDVMAAQLKHVADMARKPHIVVQVIPLEAGAHEGLNGGAFAVAEFADAPMAAYQDTALAGQIIEDQEQAGELVRTWDTLRMEALPVRVSIRMIEEAGTEWSTR
jgi:hypothetical protein